MDNIILFKISQGKKNWKVYNEYKKELYSFKDKTYDEVRSLSNIKPNYIIVEDKTDE